jgi:hypothetical protein
MCCEDALAPRSIFDFLSEYQHKEEHFLEKIIESKIFGESFIFGWMRHKNERI